MFEFGRDLRRLFEKARDSHDLGWLELVSVGLVETEARHQSTDAGRVSCARPFEAWMRAAALWREHGRRTGQPTSLHKAEQAGRDAANAAQTDDQAMQALLDVSYTAMLTFDLYGSPRRLLGLMDSLDRLPAPRNPQTAAHIKALKARVFARQSRISNDPKQMADAATQLAEAMLNLRDGYDSYVDELKLDRASLALEAGLLTRNAKLLDQAGRDLRLLVERASPDERPVSRARALALCGSGMSALATVAGDTEAREQAQALFDAAADQFTAEHSPLDWATIQLLRAERGTVPTALLEQAQAITDTPGLLLGAMLRERCLAHTISRAEETNNETALTAITQELHQRLSRKFDDCLSVDWACDQINLARAVLATSNVQMNDTAYRGQAAVTSAGNLGMALYEAADVAMTAGALPLAQRARELMQVASV